MSPINCTNVKNRGGLLGSFKQTPNDPIFTIWTPDNFGLIGPAHMIGPGAGFVGSFLIGQPFCPSFGPIGPMSDWGCCRKNRTIVGWSFCAPNRMNWNHAPGFLVGDFGPGTMGAKTNNDRPILTLAQLA